MERYEGFFQFDFSRRERQLNSVFDSSNEENFHSSLLWNCFARRQPVH